MKKITFMILMLASLTGYSQLTDPVNITRKQLFANWKFDHDTVLINRLHVGDGKFGIDSLGRIIMNNNVVPATGSFLKGNGSYFANFPRGSASQLMRVNVAGTDVEWFTPSFISDFSGLTNGSGLTFTTDHYDLGGSLTGNASVTGGDTYDLTVSDLNIFTLEAARFEITTTDPDRLFIHGLSDLSGDFVTITGDAVHFRTASEVLSDIGALSAEVDGSVSNEGSLTTSNGAPGSIVLASNTSGSTNVTWVGAGITSITQAASTVTVTSTEVDGSTSNELQTVANTSDATSHTVTLSNSGGSVQLIEGNGITLTTGGTGLNGTATVATTANGFTIVITGTQGTINDATPYYSGAVQANSGATADVNRIYIPVACTLKSGYGYIVNGGTTGSGESGTFYVRKNDATDATVSASVTTNGAAGKNTFSGTGLSTTYVAGDYIEGKWLTPTYATNPTNCRWTVILYFEAN